MHFYWTAAGVKMLNPIPTSISQDSASAKLFIAYIFFLLKNILQLKLLACLMEGKFPRIQISPLIFFQ